jgi:hypothetical protein
MKRTLDDYVVPGGSGRTQRDTALASLLAAGGATALIFADKMEDALDLAKSQTTVEYFGDILAGEGAHDWYHVPTFLLLALFLIPAVILLVSNLLTFWQGSRSIYTMRRLTDRWELLRRCCAVPLGIVAGAVVLAAVLTAVFYLAYLGLTPEGKVPPDQWTHYWQTFPQVFHKQAYYGGRYLAP